MERNPQFAQSRLLAMWERRLKHWQDVVRKRNQSDSCASRWSILTLIDKRMPLETALQQLDMAARGAVYEPIRFYLDQLVTPGLSSTRWHRVLNEMLLFIPQLKCNGSTAFHLCMIQLFYSAGLRWGKQSQCQSPASDWPWEPHEIQQLQKTIRQINPADLPRWVKPSLLSEDLKKQLHSIKAHALGKASGLPQESIHISTQASEPTQQKKQVVAQESPQTLMKWAALASLVVVIEGVLFAAPHFHSVLGGLAYWLQSGTKQWSVILTGWSCFLVIACVLWGQVVLRSIREHSLAPLSELSWSQYVTAAGLISIGVVIDFQLHLSVASALVVSGFCGLLAAWNILGWQQMLALERIDVLKDDFLNEAMQSRQLIGVGTKGQGGL